MSEAAHDLPLDSAHDQASVEAAAPPVEAAPAVVPDTPPVVTVSTNAASAPAAEAPPAVVETPAAPVDEDLPEPPNHPPPSLDPTVERPAVLPGHEGYVDQIGKMRLEIARLEAENARLTQELAQFQPAPSV